VKVAYKYRFYLKEEGAVGQRVCRMGEGGASRPAKPFKSGGIELIHHCRYALAEMYEWLWAAVFA
jgi:hypothetical protein